MSYQQFGHVDPDERLDHVGEPPPPVAEEDDEPPSRRLPGILLAVGVMAIFAGGLWFAYHQGAKHSAGPGATATTADGVPLIRADSEPVKVKPDKAGGMSIPDKDDPLYSLRPGANIAEHIQPPPEAPAPRPVAPPPPPNPAPPQVAQVGPSGPQVAPGAFPPPLPAPPQVGTPGAKAPAKLPEPAKPAPAAMGGTVKIQLASLRTPDEAREEWARIKRENADLLSKVTAVAVRADTGERGVWYRIEAGPIGDRAAAAKLCKALKERDQGCQLVQ